MYILTEFVNDEAVFFTYYYFLSSFCLLRTNIFLLRLLKRFLK